MGSDSKKSNNNSNVAGGASQIPAAAKKIVQNLKETLNKNCTDSEIYAVLVECNMDPNDAFQRLLSQGLLRFLLFARENFKGKKRKKERIYFCFSCCILFGFRENRNEKKKESLIESYEFLFYVGLGVILYNILFF